MSVVHSKLRSVTPVVTKVHVILQSFVALTWMRDTTPNMIFSVWLDLVFYHPILLNTNFQFFDN